MFDPTAETPVRDRRIGSRRAVLKDSTESAPPAERSLGAESRQLAEMLIPERDKLEVQWDREEISAWPCIAIARFSAANQRCEMKRNPAK